MAVDENLGSQKIMQTPLKEDHPVTHMKDENIDQNDNNNKIRVGPKTADDIAIDLGYNLNVIPEHYNLQIELDSENDQFSGTVIVDLFFKEFTDKFVINADEMEILSVRIDQMAVDHKMERKGNLLITIDDNPLKNKHSLEITFRGDINKKNEGFYISNYGEDKKMYSTHFEPTDARKAFPCFDHPGMKATFDITIVADEKYTILSNMPVESETVKIPTVQVNAQADTEENSSARKSTQRMKTVKFKRMPKTSTYLIAYVVGELESISDGRISVYSTYNAKLGEYALKVAVKVLDFFEKYFGIDYPLEKLDMVAIPEFSMGAMENWGLVTYRETSLLFNKKTSSMYQRARIAETVAHELAHQWFGNLVTPAWWDDLWLNEGFATWAATLVCEAIRKSEQSGANPNDSHVALSASQDGSHTVTKGSQADTTENTGDLENKDFLHKSDTHANAETAGPEKSEQGWGNRKLIDWKPWLAFIADELDRGLEADVLESSHSIKVPVSHPEEINQIFDGISYSKSASLIRMVENYLTPKVFQEKLSKYLKKYSWSNATSDNLFEILSDEQNDIKSLMNIWTSKIGFPLITLKNTHLSQSRMTLDRDQNDRSDWPIPLRIRQLSTENADGFVKTIHFKDPVDLSVIIDENVNEYNMFLNDGGFGFFRSFYDFPSKIFDKIEGMPTVNRLIFINDQVALAMSRRISFKKMLHLCQKLEHEMSPEVFDSALGFLLEMKHILYFENQEVIETIKNLVKNRLDFDLREEKDFEIMKLRASLISLAVNHDIDIPVPRDCHPMYLSNFFIQDFRKNNDLDEYITLYRKSTSELQARILNAILMTKDFNVYKKAIDLLLTNKIKQQDKTRLAISALGNLEFKEYFIHYFEENFEELNKVISSSLMMYIVEQTASWTRDINHFTTTLKNFDLKMYEQPFKRGIEKARYRLLYREQYLKGMV